MSNPKVYLTILIWANSTVYRLKKYICEKNPYYLRNILSNNQSETKRKKGEMRLK